MLRRALRAFPQRESAAQILANVLDDLSCTALRDADAAV
jgi:hypothetical protein